MKKKRRRAELAAQEEEERLKNTDARWGLGIRFHDFNALSTRIWKQGGKDGYQLALGWRGSSPVAMEMDLLAERVSRAPSVLRVDGRWFDGYYGGGVIVGPRNGLTMLVHGVVGVLIDSRKQPVEISMSVSPRVGLIPDTYFDFEVGISLHRMF
ncbi:MAG: hypothetical protein OXT67_01645 [Zetaproteobacteria bacterium]|nr:hypothetical protein [Zetaproteobacteria bacterium]